MTVQAVRYVENPLLRLLECYVLWAIGALHPFDEAQLAELGVRLSALYEREGRWHQVVAGVLELPSNMPALLQTRWARESELAQDCGEAPDPQAFAETFVDAYLT
jgi:hypothetical protein